jgi:hypothetical protein
MLLAADPATSATGFHSAAAAGSSSGCPRVTGGAVRLKDPILDYRSNDLTAIDRAQAIVKRRAGYEPPALSIACAPNPSDKENREEHEKMGFHQGWATVLDQFVTYAKTI